MVEAVAVSDQRIGDAAEIEQAIPVGIVARHTGDFQGEHDARVTERHFCGHARESGALGESGARHAQVLINDDHLFLGPTQLAGVLEQRILASGGFAVVLDLCRSGLADIDQRCALDVGGFDFARIIHDFLLSSAFPERPER